METHTKSKHDADKCYKEIDHLETLFKGSILSEYSDFTEIKCSISARDTTYDRH